MSEIKPCPFCGSSASLQKTRTIYPHVVCDSEGCEACGPVVESPDAAIEAWNRRDGGSDGG